MNATQTIKSLDLYKEVPRSPQETMAGLVHLPRMIDKARAFRTGKLGEYIFPCPLDRRVLIFLKTSPEDFLDLAEVYDDEQMAEWALETSRSRNQVERDIVNNKILDGKPDAESLPDFIKQRNRIDPARTDVTTWVDLIDLEEGRRRSAGAKRADSAGASPW